jgi:hypothetical protein
MKLDIVNKEIKNLLGIYEPSYYKCLIAVTFDCRSFLIKSENNLNELFDGSNLEDNLTNIKQIPKKEGIYKCVIKYHPFKTNIPSEPQEWDHNITIENIELIDIKL